MTEPADRISIVCFANAQLPDTDYRVALAKTSRTFDVTLALPQKPPSIDAAAFEKINVGAGLPLSSLREMFRIPSILRRRDAKFALFFATQFSSLGPIFARFAGVVPVVTITGLGRAFSAPGFRNFIARLIYLTIFQLNAWLCSAILFQNKADMDKLVSRLPRSLAQKCTLIGSGIDLSYFDLESPGRTRPARVLMVARLLPEKGVRDYLAMAQSHADAGEFVLIGPASIDHPELLAAVSRADADGHITYLGQQSSAEVRQQMLLARVLVLPSRSEGLPRVALEATASGVAVSAYDIPGCRAALGPDHPLVGFGNVVELGEQVRMLLADTERRSEIVAVAQDFVATHLSSGAYTRRLEDIFG